MYGKSNYKIEKETKTTIDEEGNESTTTVEKTIQFQDNNEPEFIKLYTKVWCEFNEIPLAYRNLFLQLALRMSFCNATDLENSQIVYTGKPTSTYIQQILGWKDSMYKKGLRVLTECNAIKRIGRGVYQINPSYASRGQWKYNPKKENGGVEDLIATFNFKTKEVNTKIIWADDGQDNDINKFHRKLFNASAEENTVAKHITKKAEDNETVDIPNMTIFDFIPSNNNTDAAEMPL